MIGDIDVCCRVWGTIWIDDIIITIWIQSIYACVCICPL